MIIPVNVNSNTTIMGKILYSDEKIIDTDALYIAHQCNCTGTKAKYTSKIIFDKYSYANVYNNRQQPSVPGTITFHGLDYSEGKGVINMYSQYFPGKPNQNDDTKQKRFEWFKECIQRIAVMSRYSLIVSVAFPVHIGCGSAGGKWELYLSEIQKLATTTDLLIYLHTNI